MGHDKIQLMGMEFYGFHGTTPEEQKLGQRFIVDFEALRDLQTAGVSDELEDTVDYSQMYDVIRGIVEGPGYGLLERVAEAISQAVLLNFDVDSVRVVVKKPEAPMKGSVLSHAAVEIYRDRGAQGISLQKNT